jgi:hypothetical protein
VPRGVASAASFVRFASGAVAPWLAGFLGERINDHVPYWVGAVAGALLGAGVLAFSRRHLLHVDTVLAHGAASMPLATAPVALTNPPAAPGSPTSSITT